MSIARHTTYNIVGALVPAVVSLLTVPFYLKIIGLERYGLLAIYWTLLGFVGFLSLGMGPAVTQRLATMANATDTERSHLVWTAMAVNLTMAVLGSILILALAHFYFTRLSATPAGLIGEVFNAIPWLALALPVSFASGVLSGALQGRQAFGVLSVINSANAILVALVPLAVAYWIGPSLANLAIATISVNLLILLTLVLVASQRVPLQRPARPSSALVRKLAAYGGWMTGTTLIVPAVNTFDRFLIGAMLGPAAVSVYVIPYNLMSRTLVLPGSLSGATLPRFASADPSEVQRLQSISLTSLVAILTPLSVVAVAAMAPFLLLWIGSDLASAATPVGVILVAGFWAHGLGYVSSTVVMGRDRPDLVMKLLLAYLIPYLALLYLLTREMGVVGAAIAWSLKSACDPLLLFVTKPDRKSVVKIIENAAIVLAAMTTGLVLPWTSPAYWTILAGLLLLSVFLNRKIVSHWFHSAVALGPPMTGLKDLLRPFYYWGPRRCPACGRHARIRSRDGMWPELVRMWELDETLYDQFDQREGAFCGFCGNSLRLRQLASVLVEQVNAKLGTSHSSLRALCDDPQTHSLEIAEINRAGSLHLFLARLPRLHYSEYGSTAAGVPSEDVLALSYPDRMFDLVVTSDTLEHVPDFPRALAEIRRVLKPDGLHIFTIPVIWDRETRQRASLIDGQLVHHLPPSHHGDATNNADDFLVFYEFGGDVQAQIRDAGFELSLVRDQSNPTLATFVTRPSPSQ